VENSRFLQPRELRLSLLEFQKLLWRQRTKVPKRSMFDHRLCCCNTILACDRQIDRQWQWQCASGSTCPVSVVASSARNGIKMQCIYRVFTGCDCTWNSQLDWYFLQPIRLVDYKFLKKSICRARLSSVFSQWRHTQAPYIL